MLVQGIASSRRGPSHDSVERCTSWVHAEWALPICFGCFCRTLLHLTAAVWLCRYPSDVSVHLTAFFALCCCVLCYSYGENRDPLALVAAHPPMACAPLTRNGTTRTSSCAIWHTPSCMHSMPRMGNSCGTGRLSSRCEMKKKNPKIKKSKK